MIGPPIPDISKKTIVAPNIIKLVTHLNFLTNKNETPANEITAKIIFRFISITQCDINLLFKTKTTIVIIKIATIIIPHIPIFIS